MNRIRTSRGIAAACAAALIGSGAAHAGTAGTGYALAGTARTMGMGGAGAAAPADAGALWLNPANLGWLTAPEAAFMHGQYVAEIGVDELVFAMPVPRGGAAVGAAWTGMGSIDSYSAAGTKVGTFSPGDVAVTGAWGYGAKQWAAGVGLGWARSELASDARAAAWFGDAGASARPMPGLVIGAAVQRLGGSLTFDREAASLPLTVRAGAAMSLPMAPVIVAADAVKTGDDDLSIRGGAEYRREVKPGLDARIRAGWRSGTPAGGVSGLSAGAAVIWRPEGGFMDRELQHFDDAEGRNWALVGIRVEYAWTPMGELGSAHWFSLGLLF